MNEKMEKFITNEMWKHKEKLLYLDKKLSIAITGLKVIISDGSDSLGVAQKTLEEIEKIELPQEQSEKE